MVSEVDDTKRFIQQLSRNAISSRQETPLSLAQVWTYNGGVAANGVKYAEPNHAIAWGSKGCPLLPREVRKRHRGLELPYELQRILGASLTVDQLDAGVLERLKSDAVWQTPPPEFRNLLYNIPIVAAQVAIPAGIPLAWLEDLPISGHTRAAVQKAFQATGADGVGFLKVPMLAPQFLGLHSVGATALNELTCVIESAEMGCTDEDPTIDLDDTKFHWESAKHEHLIGASSLHSAERISTFIRHLREVVRWAMAETDAQSLGEAISELIREGSASEDWQPIALARLTDLAAHPPHPYEALDRWVDQIDPRWKAIFMARISYDPQSIVTLEGLGVQFGVTRERIRQVEAKLYRTLGEFLISDEALPIRWRASTLRRKLSVAAPVLSVEHLLKSPPGCNDHRNILLDMAGPYDRDRDWLILRSAQSNDPTSSILTQVDEVGRIDRELATSQLTSWGMDISLHEKWLTRDDSVRIFNGQLIRWGTSISDRLAFALADIGHPATIDEMVDHVGESRSRNSIINALAGDPRLVRISRTHWALASWNQTEYSGIAESMRKFIVEVGGSIPIDTIVHRMYQMFGVAESSTLAYFGAPMFVIERRILRLRTQKDGPYCYEPNLIKRTSGVFNLGPMRLGRLLKVDDNTLRGSGTALSHAAGSILEVEVNAHLSFRNGDGDKVDITFPETSIAGPSIGSVRRIAERLSAKEGDCLTLVLDRSAMSVATFLTDLKAQSPGWDVIGGLTGIATPKDLSSLAKALGCDAGEVRGVLKARGDDEILSFLPKSESSIGLDDALAELENLLESSP